MSRSVVIAGGGPVGLMLAGELALAGVPVTVIERLPEPSTYSRSLTLHARTVEVLEQRGLDRFSASPRVPSYNFGLVEMQDYIKDPALLPRFVPQREVERLLEEHATGLGAEIRRGQEVVDLRQDGDGVTVTVRTAEGEEYELTAAYLVGCDGGRSIVRKRAGIGFPGTSSTTDGLTADVQTDPDSKVFIHPAICQAGMYAAIPLPFFGKGRYRVTAFEFGVEPRDRDVEPTVEEFQEKFRRCSGVDLDMLATGEVRHLSRVGNATRLAETYRRGRVFLAGDACHIHLPISGQGLNTGVQDALNLGWKLAAEINGWAPEGLLDTYHEERHPVGERLCWSTRAQDGLLYPLDAVQPLRELFGEMVRLDDVNQHLMATLSGLAIRYPMGYGAALPHPLIGERVPIAKISTGSAETTIAETLHSGRGVLFALGAADLPDDLAAGWSGRVDVVLAASSAEIDAGLLLARPDGYVAFAGAVADFDGARTALSRWFGVVERSQ